MASKGIVTGTITASNVALRSAVGDIGTAGSYIQVAAGKISATTFGSAFINATTATTLENSYAGFFALTDNSGALTVNGTVTGNVIILGSNTDVQINNTVTGVGSSGQIYLFNGNTITDANGLAHLVAPNLSFTSTNGSIQVGTLTSTISGAQAPVHPFGSIILNALSGSSMVTAASLNTASVGAYAGSGGVTIGTTGAVLLVASSSGGNVTLTDTSASGVALGGIFGVPMSATNYTLNATGNVAVSGAISATNITLNACGTNSSILLFNSLTASNSVTLTANGTGSITTAGSSIDSPTLTMTTGSGDIGRNNLFMVTSATSLNFTTSGNAYIFNANNTRALALHQWSGNNLIIIEDGD